MRKTILAAAAALAFAVTAGGGLSASAHQIHRVALTHHCTHGRLCHSRKPEVVIELAGRPVSGQGERRTH